MTLEINMSRKGKKCEDSIFNREVLCYDKVSKNSTKFIY